MRRSARRALCHRQTGIRSTGSAPGGCSGPSPGRMGPCPPDVLRRQGPGARCPARRPCRDEATGRTWGVFEVRPETDGHPRPRGRTDPDNVVLHEAAGSPSPCGTSVVLPSPPQAGLAWSSHPLPRRGWRGRPVPSRGGPVPGPLDGVVVVDLSRALAGPHATMVLADLGARVVKVEPPGGDDTRGWGPRSPGPTTTPSPRTGSPRTATRSRSSSTCAPTRAGAP